MANTESNSSGIIAARVNYTEMNEAEETAVIEIATNALRNTEKSERPMYHKDIAQLVKQQLDHSKG